MIQLHPSEVVAVTRRLSDHRGAQAMFLERHRAHQLHAYKPGGSMEMKPWDSPDWLPVVTEELGEVARELCEQRHGNRGAGARDVLRAELVQLGAMVSAWVAACDADADDDHDGCPNGRGCGAAHQPWQDCP